MVWQMKISRIWFASAAVLAVVYAVVSSLLPNGYALVTFGNIVQCFTLFACYLFTVPNQVRKGQTSKFWTLLSIGFALWLLQQVLWSFYEVVAQKDVPDLFWGDIVLFLHVVPMLMAFSIQPQFGERRNSARSELADSAAMFVWWAYLDVVYVVIWQYFVPNQANYNFNFNVVYGAANVSLIIASVISWYRSKGPWQAFFLHWMGASTLYALASYLASSAIDRGVYHTGCLYDVPLVAAYAWFAGIGLLGRELPATAPQAVAENAKREGLWGARLILASAAALLGIVIFTSLSSLDVAVRMFRLTLTIVAAGVFAVIFLFRQGRFEWLIAKLQPRSLARPTRSPHPVSGD